MCVFVGNNMYDFYRFTDNIHYTQMVKRESIAIIFFSIVAIIVSIIALLELYTIMKFMGVKLLAISFVTLPLVFVYNDYRINVKKENEAEV